MNAEIRMMRLPEVLRLTGLSRVTVWRLEKANAFPKSKQLAPGAIGFRSDEILRWLETRTKGRVINEPTAPHLKRNL
jgi:prophage regulatory protein